ncbi:MAG: heparinase II/III family protein [Sedimentisphaerales bacterium]|nr:heparinase II/III family protein [Sedimentisphaerales bacterium]HNY80470.1 heparinase II/III family protein [Sedimentisphaerales bacterium]HOC65194.1 heparinase II/III family protein [Sedimentisphaerales bacterium]HOH66196.1 heparinase II/III family protein [Sedimentisphaerales bacterium]HPY48490.1 heparinase II/III family protein [Sedimentisphaerales bacterium]
MNASVCPRRHSSLWLLLFVLLVVPACGAGETSALRKGVPINMAEAIIEPFWVPELSGLPKWRIDPGAGHGLRIRQNWSAVDFEWASKPAAGPALRMSRDFHVDCSAYDRLLVRLSPPKGCVTRVAVATDRGPRAFVSEPAAENRAEYVLDLQGARCIETITLELETGAEGGAAGWLTWIGLQNSERLAQYFDQWDYSGMQWDAYLKTPDATLRFEPRYGIFLTGEELADLRARHESAAGGAAAGGESEFTRRAAVAREYHPERGISEFVGSGGRTSAHSRVRDEFRPRLSGNPELAVAGLVLRDAEALRMAARYALSLAMSEHWDTGFMSVLPGSAWEDRAFRRSYTAEDIAVILDLAGEVFTDAGRTYLMRRLAEEGIGPINYVAWRHEYIFHCNQLAYFNTGRMYAYLVLERQWPRVKPYTDLALGDAIDNLENVIEPDGGSLEGPSYLNPTIRENYNAMKHYARARGRNLSELVPAIVRRTANYAAVVASTTSDDVIAVCDSGASFRNDTLRILTELVPNSYWTTLYNKQQAARGEPTLDAAPSLPAYIELPEIGYIASTRSLGDECVKVFIMGNKANAGHTHEDKGSFVLEFAGQTFAADLGICDYDDPIHAVYKQCQRHNMLVPVGMAERAAPLNPLPFDVRPTGKGDERAFRAQIDATPGWEGYYTKWVRTWDSPSPDVLTIRDEYELAKGDAVEFYWQTSLPVVRTDRVVTIRGDKGLATISVPPDCTVRIDRLPLAQGAEHTRIAIRKPAPSGTLETIVHLHSE